MCALVMTSHMCAVRVQSTPAASAKRCFLAYTTVGQITSRDESTYRAVEIEFADVNTGRPIRFNDFDGYTMAAMDMNGALFASPEIQEKDGKGGYKVTKSVIEYRPFDAWAPQSDWKTTLEEGEEAQVHFLPPGAIDSLVSCLLFILSLLVCPPLLRYVSLLAISYSSWLRRDCCEHGRMSSVPIKCKQMTGVPWKQPLTGMFSAAFRRLLLLGAHSWRWRHQGGCCASSPPAASRRVL
jgi:hypothetical protein